MNKKLRAYLPSIALFAAFLALWIYTFVTSNEQTMIHSVLIPVEVLMGTAAGALLPRSKEFKEKRKREEFYWLIVFVILIVAFVASSLINVYR